MTSHGINGHTNGRRRTMTEAEVARMGRQIDREAKVREARSPAGELTARRIYQGSRPLIVVELAGLELARIGGKRAERAEAVLVSQWPTERDPSVLEAPGAWGCRADLKAAQAEANRLATQTSMRTRGGSIIPLRHAAWAIAVPVVDEGRDFNGALELDEKSV